MPAKGATWQPDDPEEFNELLAQGWSRTALGTHYGVGRDTIRYYLRRIGRSTLSGAFHPGAARAVRQTAAGQADSFDLQSFRDALLKDIAQDTKYRGTGRTKVVKGSPDDLYAAELCLFDIHIGKYAWGEETGEDYDTEIAEHRARAAAADLLTQCQQYKLEQIVIPIGNDLLHYDNLQGTTTAGTIQDRDTRFHRMFRRARGLMSWFIAAAAEQASVRAIIVPGNHDSLSAWTLGQVLLAEYANDARVSFDDSPRKRKYWPYGKNLVAFAHGHNEPHKKLPGIMSAEEPEMWGASRVREFHVGHLHKSKVTEPVYVDDHEGCTVRVLRSLSGTDNWHSEMGYVGGKRGAECFVWKKSGGLRAQFYHTVRDV